MTFDNISQYFLENPVFILLKHAFRYHQRVHSTTLLSKRWFSRKKRTKNVYIRRDFREEILKIIFDAFYLIVGVEKIFCALKKSFFAYHRQGNAEIMIIINLVPLFCRSHPLSRCGLLPRRIIRRHRRHYLQLLDFHWAVSHV